MSDVKTIESADVEGKRVLCRVDFNVPIKDGVVTDATRIQAALPTITYLLKKGAKVILMSHLGRPQGIGFEKDYSLYPVVTYLRDTCGLPVEYSEDVTGSDAQSKAAALEQGSLLVLENVRFDKREKKNDPAFCKELASLADVYVNDAFGTAHRTHASTAGVASLLPSYAGFLVSKEVETLSTLLNNPSKPFVSILGGSKVSDKIGVIDALIETCDTLIIGGGMCFTFLIAQGHEVGTSLREDDWVQRAKATLEKAAEKGTKILLPVDIVVADAFAEDASTRIVDADNMPANMMGLDIGPKTALLYTKAIASANTVFWNGPMGVFEMKTFENGTREVALAVAENSNADTIIGGGDSVAAVNKFNLADKMTFISTGGGASMELVQGNTLPGIEALKCH